MEKVNIYHCIHIFSPQKRTFRMTAYFHTEYDFLFWQEICFQAKMCKVHEVHTSVFVEDYLSPKSNPKQLEKDIAGKTNNQYCNQYVGEIIMTCLSS